MTQEGFKRKLAAILSADVKGYSRLMEDDEEVTIRTITEYRKIIAEQVKEHEGRVVDAPGDNVLAEFASVVDALKCAVQTQKQIAEQNANLPENRKMEFRIGVNLGDVAEEGNRIYGDGVNVAARIESLADSGGICISRTAYDQVRKKLTIGYEYLGEHTVKNIDEPVRVYRVLTAPEYAGRVIGEKTAAGKKWRRLAYAAVVCLIVVAGGLTGWNIYLQRSKRVDPAAIEKMAFPLPDKPSIAVLPFANMSADPEQEYFSDGISEEIITALSSVPELFVIARNSAFTYKGKPVKVQQVSEELGVRYVLEGSVRKAKDKVRITAQLIDALAGHHLWAESYDRTLGDIFALQDEITMKIITELQVELTGKEGTRLRAPCSENLKAYLKYLAALGHMKRFSREDNAAARRLAEQAIALDPRYACAYSLLGGTYYIDVWLGATKSPKHTLMKAREMIDQAIALNPALAGPHAMLAKMLVMAGQHEKAIAIAKKAVDLDPNNVIGLGAVGFALRSAGRSEESIPFLKQAVRLDPYSSIYLYSLGLSYFLCEQYEEAIRANRKATDINPNNFLAHLCLTSTYSVIGKEEEARAAAAEVLRINPQFSLKHLSKTLPLISSDKELLMDNLRKAGLK